MKYCRVATFYRRVHTRCAIGQPGSEMAFKELMCRIVGHFLQKGCVAKLADDLFCGGYTPRSFYTIWNVFFSRYKNPEFVYHLSKLLFAKKR